MGTQILPSDYPDGNQELATLGLRRSARLQDRKKQDGSASGKAADIRDETRQFVRERRAVTAGLFDQWNKAMVRMHEVQTPLGRAYPYRISGKEDIDVMFRRLRIRDMEIMKTYIANETNKWIGYIEDLQGIMLPMSPMTPDGGIGEATGGRGRATGTRAAPRTPSNTSAPGTPQAKAKAKAKSRPSSAPTTPQSAPASPKPQVEKKVLGRAKTKASPAMKPLAKPKARANAVEALSKKRKPDVMFFGTERATTRSRTASARAAAEAVFKTAGDASATPGSPVSVAAPGSPAEAPFIEFVGAPVGKGAKVPTVGPAAGPTSMFPWRGPEAPMVTRSRSARGA
mmetsp:Transcript_100462/g.224304  ORF Transcript_100462/g.224304 Transcript_100462/m.224304 type:complete len:342 (-) Transcript_100462:207-1232(-)